MRSSGDNFTVKFLCDIAVYFYAFLLLAISIFITAHLILATASSLRLMAERVLDRKVGEYPKQPSFGSYKNIKK